MQLWHTTSASAAAPRKSAALRASVQNAVEKLFGLWGQSAVFCTGIFRRADIGDCRRRCIRPSMPSRESAHAAQPRPKAPPDRIPRGGQAAAHGGTGPAEPNGNVRAGEGGASRASQTRRAAGGGPSLAVKDGSLPDTGLPFGSSRGSPATGRGPTGPSIGSGARPGAGSAGRRLPRPSTGCGTPGALSRPVPLGGSPPGTAPPGPSPAAFWGLC